MIVGKDVALMEQILRVLTYFIRCSELAENTEVCPLLTADIDDTTTLMSVSDIATTPVTCLTADVTLSSSDFVSTSVSPVSREKLQFTAADSSQTFLLKPPSSSSIRSVRVRFENGDTTVSDCSTETSKSADQCTVFSESTASDTSVATTSVTTEQSFPVGTDGQVVPKPLLCFRADVPDSLPPLLGLTCSGFDFSQPCHDCSERFKNLKLSDLGQRDGDMIDNCKSPLCNASDMPSDCGVRTTTFTDGEKNFPFSSVPKPCQLSLAEANENVRIERVAHLGREQTEEPRPKLRHVPLEKPIITSANSCHGRTDHLPAKLSEVPPYQRSNSMFDEYFDGSPVMDLCISASGKSAFPFGIDDSSTFDEIMNEPEPCPDVSHIDVSQLSSGSSSSEVVPDPLPASDDTVPQSAGGFKMVSDSTTSAAPSSSPATFDNVFVEQHFTVASSEEHLDDIPDGPSKQMISSAIKLMQDVCSDRTSQASVDDLADVPASEYFSQTGLGPQRGRQRHPSGQSNTSARCR